jgi:hypothetical protein
MLPAPQTVLYGEHAYGSGNCVDACVASILELPLWVVPQFYQMWGRPDRNQRIEEWLALFGLGMDFVNPTDSSDDAIRLPDFYMAFGKSPRNPDTGHAVVYSERKLVHDPHPSGLGVLDTPHTYRFFYQLNGVPVHPKIPQSAYVASC